MDVTQSVEVTIDVDICCEECGNNLNVINHNGRWYGVELCKNCIKDLEQEKSK